MDAYLIIDKKTIRDTSKAIGFQMPGNPKFIWLEYEGAMKFWRSNPEVQANFNVVKVTLQLSE